MGLTLGDEQFNSILDNIKKSNNLQDEAQFNEALKQEGMTLADLRRQLERQMLASEAQRRDVVDKISITEEESREYYDAHKSEFTTPAEITLREILVEVPTTDKGVNVAQDDAADLAAHELRHVRFAELRLGGGGTEPLDLQVLDGRDETAENHDLLGGPRAHRFLQALLNRGFAERRRATPDRRGPGAVSFPHADLAPACQCHVPGLCGGSRLLTRIRRH